MNSEILYNALGWLDLFGIAVFAASGALMAARSGQTLVTFAFFALVTGVGGGTVRDLLIDAPVFWVQDARVPVLCLAIALLVWLTPVKFWKPAAVDWFDAIGLAAYSVFGAAKALQLGIDPVPAAIMGVITASVGGVIRDLIAGEPSIIVRPEIYVTAAALSAFSFVLFAQTGMPGIIAALIAFAAGFALRAMAIVKGLSLPSYRGAEDSE
ncbi:trimeric intracellular cation channel family protein [Parasphingorhabdus halotolerans]|uniref:trimeric intracellular cation channel family protein n=1 Tax=Parasphingorhabdus halotolerans TaxID=2725558 RepID=UPI001FE81135|nr:trimeric intracellular cation channel family protein [Parasphingorhabdus halotolerans]